MYKKFFTKQAAKSLQRLPKNISDLIREKISLLAEDLFAKTFNAKKLQNRPGFRLRVGDWRVIYEIQKEQLVIIVLKVALRGEGYR